jgi:hypothetical protein
MLNSKDLLEKMLLHFPRWMDIRKRYNTSTGGHLLSVYSEVVGDIQEAITDYQNDFFIDSYAGHEDDVVTFVYKGYIGTVDINTFKLINPKLDITTDLNLFYKDNGMYYFEENYIYLKTENVEGNKDLFKTSATPKIEYTIDGYKTTCFLEKIHVWNVFDEFAAFVGLERHLHETNSELTNRILNGHHNKKSGAFLNSTELGLKSAIMTELLNIDPTLDVEDIKIERPTPENLIKYYKEFGSVIEKLANVNRDVYRTKRWDIDTWTHDFKSVDYMPHAWDLFIEEFQDGVGFAGDLEVELTNSSVTDAKVTLYKKSLEKITQYVRDNNITRDIKLSLTKYKNLLKLDFANYEISASEAVDLSQQNISLICEEKTSGVRTQPIKDIISNIDMNLFSTEDTSLLPDGKYYRLAFFPKEQYHPIEIKKYSVIAADGTEISLLKENNSFKFDKTGTLVSEAIKLFVNNVSQFNSYTNIVQEAAGISLDSLSAKGYLELELNNMGNKALNLSYDCGMTPMSMNDITMTGCSINDNNEITSNNMNSSEFIEIRLTANQVSFDILKGSFTVYVEAGEEKSSVFNIGPYNYKSKRYDNPRSFYIKVAKTSSSISFANFKYSKYDFNLSFENSDPLDTNSAIMVPNTDSSTMYINMNTYTGTSPIINYIYIGTISSTNMYTTSSPIDCVLENSKKLIIESNCRVELYETDSNGKSIKTINSNYNTEIKYTAKTDASLLLDLSSYSAIKSFELSCGRIEEVEGRYYIHLDKRQTISSINIEGTYYDKVKTFELTKLMEIDQAYGDKLYVSKLSEDFIIESKGIKYKKKLNKTLLTSIAANNFRLTGLPTSIEAVFVLNNNTEIVASSCDGKFGYIKLRPKAGTMYIANNKTPIMTPETKDVRIFDTFSPALPENVLMMYTVKSLTPNYLIEFDGFGSWSIGRKSITIRKISDPNYSDNYETESLNITKSYSLSGLVELDRVQSLEPRVIDLAQYMITTSDERMSIIYKERDTSLEIEEALQSQPEFFYAELLDVAGDGFNKLKFSNIKDIVYMGYSPYEENKESEINVSQYTLLNKEGIIIWSSLVMPGKNIYIFYSIRIPKYIEVSVDLLYESIDSSIEVYEETNSFKLVEMKDEDSYVLDESAAIINVECSEPGFNAIINEGKIIFKKVYEDNTIAIKTGFYYVDGKEFYLFSNNNEEEVEKFKDAELSNVEREEGRLIVKKQATNFLINSKLTLGESSNVFNLNCENQNDIKGISSLNSITACESFNHWTTFGTTLNLVTGFNGIGINLTPSITNGYAYVDITDYLFDQSVLSLYAATGVEAYLGIERKIDSMSFNKSTVIDIDAEIPKSLEQNNILRYKFEPKENYKYYLVVKGAGIVDDIILYNNNSPKLDNVHIKAISSLGLQIDETIIDDFTFRAIMDSNKGNKSNGAEFNNMNILVNSSNIDWGITKIKDVNWERCQLSKVTFDENGIKTSNSSGSIVTDAIYLENLNTIKNFVFKINDVMFNNMIGFTVKVLGSNILDGDYHIIDTFNSNVGLINGNLITTKYIKIAIDMPENKIITNISAYVEYKTTNNEAPSESLIQTGTMFSRVFDSQYAANYKVNSIEIESISNKEDVTISIRGAKENYNGDVWTSWKDIHLTALDNGELKIVEEIEFEQCRFFQIQVVLKKRNAFIGFKYIELEVIN